MIDAPDAVQQRLNAALAGRYAVETKLGEGGMATVYLASDVKHGRKVAIKVLKPELAALVGAERFLAEIQTTATLQHPHILPLFDSGEAAGFLFYVMPYVGGDSLRERIEREKQLPLAEAVGIAGAVASALEHAHRHGVIHRDIKPANILLQDGEPVVADFGIALAVGAAGGGRLTETGLSLGTPYYMSPEQAMGDQTVGPPTDVYALGCVLYEMLVGEPPYLGKTAQAVLGKIIAGEGVSAARRRPTVPPHVDAVIRRALEKLPADRFPSAQEFAKALADPSFRHGEVAEATSAPRRWRVFVPGALVTGLVLGTAVGRAVTRPEADRVLRYSLSLPADRAFRGSVLASGVSVAWAPDGSSLVYVGSAPGGGSQLWRRDVDRLEPEAVPGSSEARLPVFSPDGASLAFTSGGALQTLSLVGGPATTVVPEGVPDAGGGIAWGSDGMLYFTGSDGALQRVPAGGGAPRTLTTPEPGSRHAWVEALPENAGLLFTITQGGPELSEIAWVSSEGGEIRRLFPGVTARYARSGHVVYTAADGTLMGVPFHLRRHETTGPPVPLVQGVWVYSGSASQFALSASGSLVYVPGGSGDAQLVRVARSGAAEEIEPGWTASFRAVALSPDGARVAVSIIGTTEDVWIKDLDQGPLSRLTFEGPANTVHAWTPDGARVLFISSRASASDLWSARADGAGEAELVLDAAEPIAHASWSPDARRLLASVGSTSARDIVTWRPGLDSIPEPVVATRFDEGSPAISPDGRWLAYGSDESGRDEVYVRPFPNVRDGRWQVSTNGGAEPAWAHSGSELFYRNGAEEMVAVEVRGTDTFMAGATTALFPASDYLASASRPSYDVTPDDQHFLMIRPVAADGRSNLVVVQNFFEELKARAGG